MNRELSLPLLASHSLRDCNLPRITLMFPLGICNLPPIVVGKPRCNRNKEITGIYALPEVGSCIIVPVHCSTWLITWLRQACVFTTCEYQAPCYRAFITNKHHTCIGECLNAIIRIVVCRIIWYVWQKCLRSKLDIETSLVVECSGNECVRRSLCTYGSHKVITIIGIEL